MTAPTKTPQGRFEFRRRARRRALQALYQHSLAGQSAAEIIKQFREEQDFSNVDAELFSTLVERVIEEQAQLDERLLPFLDRPLKQLDVVEHVILSIGAWELIHCPELPRQIVIDEAVGLANRFGASGAHGYINGVLDNAAREWRGTAAPRAGGQPGKHA